MSEGEKPNYQIRDLINLSIHMRKQLRQIIKSGLSVLNGNGSSHPRSRESQELKRLYSLPGRTPCVSNLMGMSMRVNDAGAFASMYQQTFQKEVQRFNSISTTPLIIDCGANVGVTVHYWKHLYPNANVIAFEPDPSIYQLLEQNCSSLSGVELHNCAVWTKKETLRFSSNQSVGGHFSHLSEQAECVQTFDVPTVRLRDFLEQPVALLKIDIEGAENEVVDDCADRLHNVDNLFVEHHSFTDRPQQLGRFLQTLEEAGFRLHIHTELPADRPFLNRPVFNGKDLHLNVFAFRT